MKSASLALACALLGATALAPAAFAQSSSGQPQTPAEASPSTASPDTNTRTGTQAQRDWRDQDGRIGGWSRNRDENDDRYSSRDSRGGRYAEEDDDDDDDDMASSGSSSRSGGMGSGSESSMGSHSGSNGGSGMRAGGGGWNSAMMRMHMQMMNAQNGARFNLKRGDSQMRVRCPGNENISACVDAVGKLMDRLQAMPQTPPRTP